MPAIAMRKYEFSLFKNNLLSLLDDFINTCGFIPQSFYSSYYSNSSRIRKYSLESLFSVFVLKNIESIPIIDTCSPYKTFFVRCVRVFYVDSFPRCLNVFYNLFKFINFISGFQKHTEFYHKYIFQLYN